MLTKRAPGERLVADAQPALGGPRRELVQLLGDAVVVVEGVRGDRRADQDEVRAELLHDVELALGPAEVRREHVGVVRVEVTEGLVQVDREAEVGAPGTHLGGGPRGGDEVRLEDLHAVEAGGRGRHQLVLQRAGQAHGRDRRSAGRPSGSGATATRTTVSADMNAPFLHPVSLPRGRTPG